MVICKRKGVSTLKVLFARVCAIGSMVALLCDLNVKFIGALSASALNRFTILVPMGSILFFVLGLFLLFFKPSKDGYNGIDLIRGEDALVVALVFIIFCIGLIVLLEPTWFLDKVILLGVF